MCKDLQGEVKVSSLLVLNAQSSCARGKTYEINIFVNHIGSDFFACPIIDNKVIIKLIHMTLVTHFTMHCVELEGCRHQIVMVMVKS